MSKLLIFSSLYRFIVLVFVLVSFSGTSIGAEKASDTVSIGKKLTIKLCQACHSFTGAEQAGTVAPPFAAMKARFPKREKLFDIIYNPQVAIKSHTMMPPFGKHNFLNTQEINNIIKFLYTQ